jgi:diadenosine tetraphosphate (Ap4A) HIT family hydrolase
MTTEHFELHPQLARDCHVLGSVDEGLVLLHKNASLPWFLLVPRTDAGQLHELGAEERIRIQARWNDLAAWVSERFACDRVNVAAIGNVVPQLHLHTVGRRAGDPVWPGVPWGQSLSDRSWSDEDLAGLRRELAGRLEMV